MYKTRNKYSKTTEVYQFHFNMLQTGSTDTKYCRLTRLSVFAFYSISLQIHPKTMITIRHFESVHYSSSGRINRGQKLTRKQWSALLQSRVEWIFILGSQSPVGEQKQNGGAMFTALDPTTFCEMGRTYASLFAKNHPDSKIWCCFLYKNVF